MEKFDSSTATKWAIVNLLRRFKIQNTIYIFIKKPFPEREAQVRMSHLKRLVTIIAIISTTPGIWTIEFPECENVTEPDTFVSSQRSCAKYIFCDGEASFEGECLGGNYFNEIEGICDDPENVECDIVEDDSVSSIYDEKFQKSDKNENEKDSEENGFFTADEVNELEFDQDRDPNGVSDISEAAKCSSGSGNVIHHIPHRDSCSAFFTCYNGMAIPMLCPRNLYFNPDAEKCEEQMPQSCKVNEINL